MGVGVGVCGWGGGGSGLHDYCPLSLSNPMFDEGNLTKKPFSHKDSLL